MTYSLSQFLSDTAHAQDASEANESFFAATMPWWEEAEIDPEERTLIPENDVLNPSDPFVTVHDEGTRVVLHAGCDGEFEPFSVEYR